MWHSSKVYNMLNYDVKEGKEKNGKYKLEIIYEKEEKKQANGSNVMAIDLGMNNLATCTNMKNNKSLIMAGESLKSKIGYINKEIARTNEDDRKEEI